MKVSFLIKMHNETFYYILDGSKSLLTLQFNYKMSAFSENGLRIVSLKVTAALFCIALPMLRTRYLA